MKSEVEGNPRGLSPVSPGAIEIKSWKQRLERIQDTLLTMPDSIEKAIILEETIQLWRTWKSLEKLIDHERNRSNSSGLS